MPYCPNCGTQVSEDDEFCKKCGYQIITVIEESRIVPKNDRSTRLFIYVIFVSIAIFGGYFFWKEYLAQPDLVIISSDWTYSRQGSQYVQTCDGIVHNKGMGDADFVVVTVSWVTFLSGYPDETYTKSYNVGYIAAGDTRNFSVRFVNNYHGKVGPTVIGADTIS